MKDRFSSDNFDPIYLLPCSGNVYNSVRARCRWQVSVGCVCGRMLQCGGEQWEVEWLCS